MKPGFSAVQSRRPTSNRHKLQHGKFQLDKAKKIFTDTLKEMKPGLRDLQMFIIL